MDSLGFIFRSVPHGSNSGREGLDAVLACSAYTDNVALFFIGDGVFQLLQKQQPDSILSRDYISTFKMLDLYDIENVYVCRDSMLERGIVETDFLIEVKMCERNEISSHLQTCRQTLTF